jgi:hypothetical protein
MQEGQEGQDGQESDLPPLVVLRKKEGLETAWEVFGALGGGRGLDVLVYGDIGMDLSTYKYAMARLARVQINYMGHPTTSGMPAIDYYFTSDHFEPASEGGMEEGSVGEGGVGEGGMTEGGSSSTDDTPVDGSNSSVSTGTGTAALSAIERSLSTAEGRTRIVETMGVGEDRFSEQLLRMDSLGKERVHGLTR